MVKKDITKTEEMKRFEEETKKNAIWKGQITEEFKKWKKGKKIYNRNKKRLSLYVSEENELKWKNFIQSNKDVKGFSDLIRKSVNEYLKNQSNYKINDINIPQISHDLKEPLTIIKASSQLLLDNFGNQFSHDSLDLIKNIFESSLMLENKIKHALDEEIENDEYDVLIIDDYYPTILLLTKYFKYYGYNCKTALSGREGINLLEKGIPKLILLDILLPDISGYEVCKIIKSKLKYGNVKLFYITAFPSTEIEKNIVETGADGYFLKPFNLSDLNSLFDILNI
ncbi:MAG: response regulator [Promethearchaeota archaeon]